MRASAKQGFIHRPGRGSFPTQPEKREPVDVRNGRELEHRRFERLTRDEQLDELIKRELAR